MGCASHVSTPHLRHPLETGRLTPTSPRVRPGGAFFSPPLLDRYDRTRRPRHACIARHTEPQTFPRIHDAEPLPVVCPRPLLHLARGGPGLVSGGWAIGALRNGKAVPPR